MSLYWPAFEFSYRLDMPRLLPHIAAIEAGKAAASMRILPPQWRKRADNGEAEAAFRAIAEKEGVEINEIQVRKLQLLQTNASRAQAWVRERFYPGSAPLSLEDILGLHRMIADEAGIRYNTPGEMRKEGFQVVVGTPGIGFHTGAPASRVQELMREYIQFVNSPHLRSMPAAIHTLIAHYFITTIHPFDDGNGRVSRLVSAGILFERGYNGHGFHALSSYFYDNEERYHTILLAAQQDASPDLTEFVAFGLAGLAQELRGINHFMRIKLQRIVDREAPSEKRHRRRRSARKSPMLKAES
jgi:Fic family protein